MTTIPLTRTSHVGIHAADDQGRRWVTFACFKGTRPYYTRRCGICGRAVSTGWQRYASPGNPDLRVCAAHVRLESERVKEGTA